MFFLTLLLIYLFGVLFFRYILPFLLTLGISRMLRKSGSQAFRSRQETTSRREGDVTIDTPTTDNAKRTKIFQQSDGEYIDYEEIK